MVKIFALPSELYRHARACGDVRSGGGGLLAGEAAANRIELKAGVLGGFYGAAKRLADEGGDFDAALLYVEHYRAA